MKKIKTRENLEAAFAGESMAHMRYKYFAKLAREMGDDDVAEIFEKTAKDEIAHSQGHLRFLYPKEEMTPKKMLEIAIEGEAYEYTEMYPKFAQQAEEDGMTNEKKEFLEHVEESKEHESRFIQSLNKISKVFKGLTKVEEKHANDYRDTLKKLQEN